METQRPEFKRIAPEGLRPLVALEAYLKNCGLEKSLIDLVMIRSSQINGCAYCIDMHTKLARAHGENEQRLYLLSAWRESPQFTERERTALTWTESMTLVSQMHASREDYDLARAHFSEKELVDLTLAITAINSWNRLEIGFRGTPGTYRVAA